VGGEETERLMLENFGLYGGQVLSLLSGWVSRPRIIEEVRLCDLPLKKN
jgi:hypothetical protein